MPVSSQMVSSDDTSGAYSMPVSQDAASTSTSSSAGRNTYSEPWIQEFDTAGEASIGTYSVTSGDPRGPTRGALWSFDYFLMVNFDIY